MMYKVTYNWTGQSNTSLATNLYLHFAFKKLNSSVIAQAFLSKSMYVKNVVKNYFKCIAAWGELQQEKEIIQPTIYPSFRCLSLLQEKFKATKYLCLRLFILSMKYA